MNTLRVEERTTEAGVLVAPAESQPGDPAVGPFPEAETDSRRFKSDYLPTRQERREMAEEAYAAARDGTKLEAGNGFAMFLVRDPDGPNGLLRAPRYTRIHGQYGIPVTLQDQYHDMGFHWPINKRLFQNPLLAAVVQGAASNALSRLARQRLFTGAMDEFSAMLANIADDNDGGRITGGTFIGLARAKRSLISLVELYHKENKRRPELSERTARLVDALWEGLDLDGYEKFIKERDDGTKAREAVEWCAQNAEVVPRSIGFVALLRGFGQDRK